MKNKLLQIISLIIVVSLLLIATGCTTKPTATTAAEAKVKVCFIFNTPLGDPGWTARQNAGRLDLEKALPYVETKYLENVAEGSDTERALTELAQDGCKLIVAANYGYMDSVIKVAQQFPDVKFLHASGYKTAENVSTYYGRMYYAQYLAGVTAGYMSTSGKIGFVAAVPIPEMFRDIDAFTLGARSVNPDATVNIVWTNTWYDPASEREAAEGLIAVGCDVITHFTNSSAPVQAADEKGIYSISMHADMSEFAPNRFLVGRVWNWAPILIDATESIKNNTWKTTQYWWGIKEGVVDISKFGKSVPENVVTAVNEVRAKMLAGESPVFSGPIYDVDGTLRVKEGETLDDSAMLSLDWFVQGVVGGK